MSLKRHLEGDRFYDNEELEMAVREWIKVQKSGISVRGDRLKIMTSGVTKQSYIYCFSLLFSINVLHISLTKDYLFIHSYVTTCVIRTSEFSFAPTSEVVR